MAGAGWALQRAVHQRLTMNGALLALLGGPNVWDHVPRAAAYPYVTFGVSTNRDWSTGSEDGVEHVFTLHIWSAAAGRHEIDGIAFSIRAALHDAPMTLDGHRLVNLRLEFADARRETDNELYHGILRLRAVTEPLA